MRDWYDLARSALRYRMCELGKSKAYDIDHEMEKLNKSCKYLMSSPDIQLCDLLIEVSKRGCEHPVDRINGIIGKLNIEAAFNRNEKLCVAVRKLMLTCCKELRIFLLCWSQAYTLHGYKCWLPTLDVKFTFSKFFKWFPDVSECYIDSKDNLHLYSNNPAVPGKLTVTRFMIDNKCTYDIQLYGAVHYNGQVIISAGYSGLIYDGVQIGELSLGCLQDIGSEYLAYDMLAIPLSLYGTYTSSDARAACNMLMVSNADSNNLHQKLGIVRISEDAYQSSQHVKTCKYIIG